MARRTRVEIIAELESAIAAGSIRNVDFKELSDAANRQMERECTYRNPDIAPHIHGQYDRNAGLANSNLIMAALYSTPHSVMHVPGWLKRATKKDIQTISNDLAAFVQAYRPWARVAELLITARPLIVKGRKPDPEGEAKRAERLKGTQTCQYCGGAWKLAARSVLSGTADVITHHGYRRPLQGSGVQTASCPGARELQYEVSANLIPMWIEANERARLSAEIEAKRFADKPKHVTRDVYTDKKTGFRMVTICNEYGHTLRTERAEPFGNEMAERGVDGDYERRRAILQAGEEAKERLHRAERDRLQKRLNAWTMNNAGWRGRVGER